MSPEMSGRDTGEEPEIGELKKIRAHTHKAACSSPLKSRVLPRWNLLLTLNKLKSRLLKVNGATPIYAWCRIWPVVPIPPEPPIDLGIKEMSLGIHVHRIRQPQYQLGPLGSLRAFQKVAMLPPPPTTHLFQCLLCS